MNRFKKRIFLPILFSATLLAHNLQLHYDLGRKHFTSTFEMYVEDKLGYTFWFMDIDYNNPVNGFKNASLAYGEFFRYFSISRTRQLYFTIQYNDGLTNSFSFSPVWLAGIQAPILKLPCEILLRKEVGTRGLTFQVTFVWFYDFERFEISGYIDIWNTGNGYPKNRLAFMSEPQFWYKVTPSIYLGGEIEISTNFSGAWTKDRNFQKDKLFIIPTVGLKWVF